MSQIIGWGGWSWPGWSAIAALGAATAAGAALWALFYFRKQAGVMLEQLKDAQRDEHSRQKQRLEEAQMSVTPLVSLEGGPVSLPENAGHNYQARVTAHADGAGFAHNLILNTSNREKEEATTSQLRFWITSGQDRSRRSFSRVRSTPFRWSALVRCRTSP